MLMPQNVQTSNGAPLGTNGRIGTVCLLGAFLFFTGCGSPLVESGSASRSSGGLRPGQPVSIGNPAGRLAPTDLQNVPRVPASSAVTLPSKTGEVIYHEVLPGDTATSVARRYGTTVDRLLKMNGLEPSSVLQRGQLLAIPQ